MGSPDGYERMTFADTVFFMDYNTITCLNGAFRRLLLKKRPDPIAGCKERIDLDFLKWILGFKKKQTDRINLLLSDVGADKQVYIFKKRKDSKKYLDAIWAETKKNG